MNYLYISSTALSVLIIYATIKKNIIEINQYRGKLEVYINIIWIFVYIAS